MSTGLVSAAIDYLGMAISSNSKCFPFQFAQLTDSSDGNTTCDAYTTKFKSDNGLTDLSCFEGAKVNLPGYVKIECATSVDAFAAKTFPGIKYFGNTFSFKANCSDPYMVAIFAADGSCIKDELYSGGGATGSTKITVKGNGNVTLNLYNSNDCSGTAKPGSRDLQLGKCDRFGSGLYMKYYVGGSAKNTSTSIPTSIPSFAFRPNFLGISVCSILASILFL